MISSPQLLRLLARTHIAGATITPTDYASPLIVPARGYFAAFDVGEGDAPFLEVLAAQREVPRSCGMVLGYAAPVHSPYRASRRSGQCQRTGRGRLPSLREPPVRSSAEYVEGRGAELTVRRIGITTSRASKKRSQSRVHTRSQLATHLPKNSSGSSISTVAIGGMS